MINFESCFSFLVFHSIWYFVFQDRYKSQLNARIYDFMASLWLDTFEWILSSCVTEEWNQSAEYYSGWFIDDEVLNLGLHKYLYQPSSWKIPEYLVVFLIDTETIMFTWRGKMGKNLIQLPSTSDLNFNWRRNRCFIDLLPMVINISNNFQCCDWMRGEPMTNIGQSSPYIVTKYLTDTSSKYWKTLPF